MNIVQAILVNWQGALGIFETTIMHSSKEEATPRANGLIVLDEIGKLIVSEILDYGFKTVPGGEIVNKVYGLGQSIFSAIEAEKKRSATATESNTLKNFIWDLGDKISESQSNLMTTQENIIGIAHRDYGNLDKSEQIKYRRKLLKTNHYLTKLHKRFTKAYIFTRICELWINKSKIPGKNKKAQIEIALDKDWNVIKAYINAPRGSRLAEDLLRSNGGNVDLTDINVPRFVTWFPLPDKEGNGLARCFAKINAQSKITETGCWYFGKPYHNKFRKLISTKPIPNTVKLSGHKTE